MNQFEMFETGRVKQKKLTRHALLQAAYARHTAEKPLTIVKVAKDAGVSTATAYRYFKDPETLRLEATLRFNMAPEISDLDKLDEALGKQSDLIERVLLTQRIIVGSLVTTESTYRLFLAKNHQALAGKTADDDFVSFSPRRKKMLESALAPAKNRLKPSDWTNAILGLSAACGPEPYFTLKDQFRQTDNDSAQIIETNLRHLTQALVLDKLR